MKNRWIRVLMSAVAVLVLAAACGQKGPLRHPDNQQANGSMVKDKT